MASIFAVGHDRYGDGRPRWEVFFRDPVTGRQRGDTFLSLVAAERRKAELDVEAAATEVARATERLAAAQSQLLAAIDSGPSALASLATYVVLGWTMSDADEAALEELCRDIGNLRNRPFPATPGASRQRRRQATSLRRQFMAPRIVKHRDGRTQVATVAFPAGGDLGLRSMRQSITFDDGEAAVAFAALADAAVEYAAADRHFRSARLDSEQAKQQMTELWKELAP